MPPAPRALKFVRSTRHLRRAAGGRRLCLTFGLLRPGQQTFRATFRLRANVTAGTVRMARALTPPRVRAVSDPARRPPQAAATPGRRQGRRGDRGAGHLRPGAARRRCVLRAHQPAEMTRTAAGGLSVARRPPQRCERSLSAKAMTERRKRWSGQYIVESSDHSWEFFRCCRCGKLLDDAEVASAEG